MSTLMTAGTTTGVWPTTSPLLCSSCVHLPEPLVEGQEVNFQVSPVGALGQKPYLCPRISASRIWFLLMHLLNEPSQVEPSFLSLCVVDIVLATQQKRGKPSSVSASREKTRSSSLICVRCVCWNPVSCAISKGSWSLSPPWLVTQPPSLWLFSFQSSQFIQERSLPEGNAVRAWPSQFQCCPVVFQ